MGYPETAAAEESVFLHGWFYSERSRTSNNPSIVEVFRRVKSSTLMATYDSGTQLKIVNSREPHTRFLRSGSLSSACRVSEYCAVGVVYAERRGGAVSVHNFAVAGTDLEAATALFVDEYKFPDFASAPSEVPFSWGHSIRGDDQMTFRTSSFMGTLSGVPESADDYIVWWNVTGRSVIGSGRAVHDVLTETPLLLSPDRPSRVQHFDVVHNLVHLNRNFVESVARESFGAFAGFVSLGPGSPSSPEKLKQWRRTVTLVAQLWLPDPSQLSDIMRHELARMMAVILLETYPRVVADIRVESAGADAAKVRLAVEFVHTNAHRVITSTDMAAAAGLSPRALQLAFRRHLNTTPTGLLRSVRLERVHDELAVGNFFAGRVSEIARQWGFSHLGRFAADYYEKYDELPSDTGKRAAY